MGRVKNNQKEKKNKNSRRRGKIVGGIKLVVEVIIKEVAAREVVVREVVGEREVVGDWGMVRGVAL